jgi:gliding motility-associated-like protein
LLLTGSGIKTLAIDARVGNLLALNDRELATNANTMYVDATAAAAITRTTGFVSSLAGGTLSRATASNAMYLFPTGSSVGTLRYRPVQITPASASATTYTVRLANNDASTDGYNRTNIDTTICEANPNFYHMITRSAGTTAADIAVNFDVADGAWEGLANWITPSTQWQTMGTVTVASNFVTKAAWNTYTYEPYILTRRKADAEITAVPPMCENIAAINLTAAESGGTWTGTGITNGSTGTFNPSTAGAGTHTITYTIPGTCGDADNVSITVHAVATLDAITTNESCISASNGSIDLTVNGGTAPYIYNWDNTQTIEDISNLSPGAYIIIVSDANNCSVTQTYNILAGTEPCLPESFYIPNIFSPNGDNINDVFYVRGNGIKTIHISIYDRWGEKIFETNDVSEGWDGTFHSQMMESAVFVYYIDAEMESGSVYKEKGNITLVR